MFLKSARVRAKRSSSKGGEMEEAKCPYIQRKQADDETYDICVLNTNFCLIEHGYECETWNKIKEEDERF